MVVQDVLRLDRRVVADRDRAVRLAVDDAGGGLGDREEPAHAVVRDAGVRPLDAEPDADVAQHVVRQRLEQPHRVHGASEVAAERRKRPARLDDQREIVVLVLVVAAAGARVEAGALGERGRRGLVEAVAVRDEPRLPHRLARRVETDDVGAPDELQQLAVASELRGVVVGDLGGDRPRPVRDVPRGDRRQRAAAREDRVQDRGGRLAGAADRARAGDHDSAFGAHRRPPSKSGWRNARQLFDPPNPSELDSATRTGCRRAAPTTRLRSQSGSGFS